MHIAGSNFLWVGLKENFWNLCTMSLWVTKVLWGFVGDCYLCECMEQIPLGKVKILFGAFCRLPFRTHLVMLVYN